MATHTKLSEMGTTGLIDYVASQRGGRRLALARVNAERVLRRRYTTNPDEAVRRVDAAWHFARLTAGTAVAIEEGR